MTPALVAYFGLYAWLRATNVIELWSPWKEEGSSYLAKVQDNPEISAEYLFIYPGGKWSWPRSWTMKAMWPAANLEVALDVRGWLPWSITREPRSKSGG